MEKEQLVSLVTKAQNGDNDALNELFNSFYNDLYYFALKTVKDEELACDVTQEAFIEIINTIENLKEPAAFVTWAKQITYHQCTRYFKKKKDVIVDEDEDGNTVFDNLKEENAEFIPDEALDQSDFKKTIMTILDELSEEQRSATMMYYFDEMSVKEIAEIQGVSEGTIKSRLNYSRKAIKASVEEYEKKNNIKLHALPFLPLFKWVFGGSFQGGLPLTSAKLIAEGVSSASGTVLSVSTAATTAATATASATATTGLFAKIVALPLVTKIVAGAAATIIIAGSTTAGVILSNKSEDPTPYLSSQKQQAGIALIPEAMATVPEGWKYITADGATLNAGEHLPTPQPKDHLTNGVTYYIFHNKYKTTNDEMRQYLIGDDCWYIYDSKATEPYRAEEKFQNISGIITHDYVLPLSWYEFELSGSDQTSTEHPTASTGFTVPENATYICKDGTKYGAGQIVASPPTDGDVLETTDYTYKYNQHYYSHYDNKGMENPKWESGCLGWGVRVRSTTKTEYSEILTKINGEPITCMHNTFAECTKMKYSPAIPKTVTDLVGTYSFCESLIETPSFANPNIESMMGTFQNCTSLKTIDPSFSSLHNLKFLTNTFLNCSSLEAFTCIIPDGVTDMTNTFAGCSSLKTFNSPLPSKLQYMPCTFSSCSSLTTISVTIPSTVTNMTSTFVGCSKLSATLEINAKKLDEWDSCFLGTKSIILKGESPHLTDLANTSDNNNVTVK